MRAIFEATQRSFVSYEPLRRIMAAGNDTGVFESLVSSMSVLLPVDLVLPQIKAPVLTSHGFVRNMLRLSRFEYDTTVEMLRRWLPVYHDASTTGRMMLMGSGRLYVTSLAYAWLSTGTTNALLADAPVLASRMASLMWTKVYAWDWSEHTKKALKSFRECVEQSERLREYDTRDDLFTRTMGLRIAAAVGAASSVAEGAATSEWYRTKSAWSLYLMSEAQFFYARYAYFRCSEKKAPSAVNGPTRYSTDFAVAFQCLQGSRGSNETGCLSVALKDNTFGDRPGDSAVSHLVNT
ncbi:hypothetical protein HPB52_011346 [Rhipicephalus sanguineus]|uniref:Uncharacterized protein n=1 Tax=Rhipicephalus sanguineus TaxID=34632 RepID=A0A9D4SP10_RHISA|nr:hypothetical protein HPB52_011346 [Rhipicephalus sanguineus]